jgi:hypothetical protein
MTTLRFADAAQTIDQSALDPQTKVELKSKMLSAAATLPDTWIYRIVVLALGLAIFVPLAGLFASAQAGDPKALVQMLLPISTAALGALAGLLAPSPAARNS